ESTLNEESPKESASDRILSHCFKQPNRFGPPKPRRRILIAPPMDSVAPCIHKPQPPVPSEGEKVQQLTAPPEAQDSISTEESDLLNMEAWIKERKQLRNLLENCVNLEEWLTEKKPLTQQEESILRKIKKEREEAKIQAKLLALQSVKVSVVGSQHDVMVQNQQEEWPFSITSGRLHLSRAMKFKRVDFLRIIQEKKMYCTIILLYNRNAVLFLQRKTTPLDFAEQCRLVRSGDPVVDSHCLPSSLEGEVGELVDQHRLACHYVYCQCVKLCEKYGIPISERALKRGIKKPNNEKECLISGSPNLTPCFIDSGKPKPIKKPVKKLSRACRWKSFGEFKKLMRRMYHYLNPLTNPSNFWPGHLLDKLHLYLPEPRQDRSEVLFSHVSHTRPVNPGINVPRRNWPVNNKGYMTLGDPETRKHNYYI
uniref:Uncharacterized protein n=1 Tax=Naja naja TaxID=35670 RepID=A0A8C6YKJ3_NAJNA